MNESEIKQTWSWGALMFDGCPKCGRKLRKALSGLWYHGQKKRPEGKCKFVIRDQRKCEIVEGIENQPLIQSNEEKE